MQTRSTATPDRTASPHVAESVMGHTVHLSASGLNRVDAFLSERRDRRAAAPADGGLDGPAPGATPPPALVDQLTGDEQAVAETLSRVIPAPTDRRSWI